MWGSIRENRVKKATGVVRVGTLMLMLVWVIRKVKRAINEERMLKSHKKCLTVLFYM